jgi:hypothetical protein
MTSKTKCPNAALLLAFTAHGVVMYATQGLCAAFEFRYERSKSP